MDENHILRWIIHDPHGNLDRSAQTRWLQFLSHICDKNNYNHPQVWCWIDQYLASNYLAHLLEHKHPVRIQFASLDAKLAFELTWL